MKIAFRFCEIIDFERLGGVEKVKKFISSFVFPKNDINIPIKLNKKNKDTKWYFPRVSLVKSVNKIDGENIFFQIECSLQKTIFNNNLYEAREDELCITLRILQDKLFELGVWIDIEHLANAFISRIDYSKNILIPSSIYTFIRQISKVSLDARIGKVDRDYQEGGASFKAYTKRYHILIYDKIKELLKTESAILEDNKLYKELKAKNKNILRFECSFRRNKLRELDKTLNLNIGELRLKNLFKKDIAQTILQYYSNNIFDGLRQLDLDSSKPIEILDRINNAYPKATRNKIEKLFTQTVLASEYGMDFLKNRLEYQSPQMSEIKSCLKAINSNANSPYSSTIKNIHAVENCLKEFSLFRPRYWNEE